MSWFKSVLPELLRDQNERLKAQNDWLQSQVESLQAKILEMKQQGFVHEPTVVQKSMTPDLPDVVAAAIEMAGPRLAPDLTEWALSMLKNGVDPEHVADQLIKGGTFDA